MLERTAYIVGNGDRFRDEPSDWSAEPNRNDKRTLHILVTKARHVECVSDRVAPGRQHRIEILRQRVRIQLLPFMPEAIDVGMNGPEDRIERRSQVTEHVARLRLAIKIVARVEAPPCDAYTTITLPGGIAGEIS